MKPKTMSLPVRLSDEERTERTAELLRVMADREALEEERRAVASGFKERIGLLTARIQELADALRSGQEERDVQIEERAVPARGVVEVYRLDTGERAQSRPMTDDDRQVPLIVERDTKPENVPEGKARAPRTRASAAAPAEPPITLSPSKGS